MSSPGTESQVAETPDTLGAYPRLTPLQLQTLSEVGTTVPVSEGQVLARAGEPLGSFFAVIEGLLLVDGDDSGPDRSDEEPRGPDAGGAGARVEVHGPGRFVGDIGLLEGEPAFATITALESGKVLAVPIPALQRIVTGEPLIGDVILRAYLIRRSMAIGFGSGLRIVGSRLSPDTRRLLDFAARNRIPHRLVDLERDPAAETIVQRLGVEVADVPVVIVGGSRILRNPSIIEVSDALGLRRARPRA